MAEDKIRLSEAMLVSDATPSAAALYNAEAMSRVWLWDCGPAKPGPPARPDVPKGKEGDPLFDLAMIEFRELLETYSLELKTFARMRDEHAAFARDYGGPYLIPFWSVNASEALQNDLRAVQEKRQPRRRYYLSSRTRGYGELPNGGLPEGMKPGHKHAENLQREQDGDSEMIAARRRDPVFGEQELRT